jgi:hypothetical protein
MSTRGNADLSSQLWNSSNGEGDANWSIFMQRFTSFISAINQVYLKIIMFGFLIAMIKTTCENNNKFKIQN